MTVDDREELGSPAPPLELRGISKSFGSTHALTDVDLDVRPGEVLCLVGENGAGKSTLGKIVAGFERQDAGELRLGGEPLPRLTPRSAIDRGIGIVSQEVDVISSVSVAENLFLGDEATHGPLVDWRTMQRITGELAALFGVELDPTALVETLSPAQKQLVQILRALRREARIIVFDESSSSLGGAERSRLHAMIRQLASKGVAVVYVSHILDEVFEIGDRAAVLKDGRLVAVHEVRDITAETLIKQMVGRDEASYFTRSRAGGVGDVGLRIEHYSGRGVADVDLEVRHGEILGLGGLVGAGRSELADLLFGVSRRTSGRLVLDGVEITPRSPAQAIERGICMLTEDRQRTGLLKGRSVSENISVVRSERAGAFLHGERSLAMRMSRQLQIASRGVDQDVTTLSGGNQQKVLLARWLAVESARVFILDEPTRGVDIGAKHEIYRLVEALADKGCVIILISSDLPELLSLSDRIAVMRKGRVVGVVPAAEATEESLVKEFIGVAAA